MNFSIKNHLFVFILILTISCQEDNRNTIHSEGLPTPIAADLWIDYTEEATEFKIWSPNAEKVKLNLYKEGNGGKASDNYFLNASKNGVWTIKVDGDLNTVYYTYQVMINGKWLEETPGIYAKAVGVNGLRAMVLDMKNSDPDGWVADKGPFINFPNEAIIYELHIRDMTIQNESGSSIPGKYLGLVEEGTTGPEGVSTGIDHIKELGVNFVHLLPSYDHYSIDETRLDSPQFNWGYDPQNYNVPEGSFSSDPYHAEVRIKEFKEMVKAFHENGIGVILDVVYNHTGRTSNANFNLEAPGYYYRTWDDGSLSDASGCGNETASEKEMMRKFMIESVKYWAEEYHIDGFRFDLMGIHDIQTMNEIAVAVKKVNPSIILYGEGWTASDSPLASEKLALKKNTKAIPQISAFSDDIRDGIKGSVFEDESTGFVSGALETEESIKFGIVGSIQHPQINYAAVNYSDAPWSNEPWQAISYVSCHDNHTLYDKLMLSSPGATQEEIIAMDKLANAIVMTSQGIAFIHAGSEMLRTKNGEHNSYNLPDSINQIDWNWKVANADVFRYYKNLISLRKTHPAFRMITAKNVRENLQFQLAEEQLISYEISNNANGDEWKNILIIYNAKTEAVDYKLEGEWQLAVISDDFDLKGKKMIKNSVNVPAISMLVAFQK